MKIVILGNGILADEFESFCFNVIRTDIQNISLDEFNGYDTIINTHDKNISTSTTESVSTMYVYNAELPARLSKYCNENNKKFVHISTSHLYGNSCQLKNEESEIFAQSAYETTKLLGEKYCSQNDLIIRTQNIFNGIPHEDNTLYQLIKNPKNIDIKTSFTYTKDIIRSISKLLKDKQSGIFNIASCSSQPTNISKSSYKYHSKITLDTLKDDVKGFVELDVSKLHGFHLTEDADELLPKCYAELLLAVEI